jgi:hypothetical protein
MFVTILKGFSWFPAADKYCSGVLPSLLLIAWLSHFIDSKFHTEETKI